MISFEVTLALLLRTLPSDRLHLTFGATVLHWNSGRCGVQLHRFNSWYNRLLRLRDRLEAVVLLVRRIFSDIKDGEENEQKATPLFNVYHPPIPQHWPVNCEFS